MHRMAELLVGGIILVGLAFAPTWATAATGGSTVRVVVSGLSNGKGHVLGFLCSDEKKFMHGCGTYMARAKAQPGKVTLVFKDVAAGTYALSVIDDENDNLAYDYPNEAYAYGNNAAYPPSFEAAAIKVSGDTSVEVALKGGASIQQSGALPSPTLGADVAEIPVHASGLDAELYLPKHAAKLPGVLALGGSEGGLATARYVYAPLAEHGYAVMVLAYFGADDLAKTLVRIPLEYFETALDWLKARPEVDAKRIGIVGGSKGAEVALAIASHDPIVKAVVAAAPSSVVWQGLDFRPGATPHSSWTLGGKDLSFVPYDTTKPFSPSEPLIELYKRSLAAQPDHPDAVIPVERIRGAVLLFSGTDDKLWPSTQMSDQIIARLDAHRFPYAHEHVSYKGAGHTCCEGDPAQAWPAQVEARLVAQGGGTMAINAKARADAWARTLRFLDAHLMK